MPPPIVPPAPARLSTITDWPRRPARLCASGRPTRSVVPPAANGTTKVIGFVGHSCAAAKLQLSIERAQAMPAIFRVCVDMKSSGRPRRSILLSSGARKSELRFLRPFNILQPHPEEPALLGGRLEGWPQTPSVLPSFETRRKDAALLVRK